MLKYLLLLICFLGRDAGAGIIFTIQKRVPAPGKNNFKVVTQKQQWDASKTAIIICDMWDEHWCRGASSRVSELAPYMNSVLNVAREKEC